MCVFPQNGICESDFCEAGENKVLMSPCLIWKLEVERSFLCFGLFNHKVKAVYMHM